MDNQQPTPKPNPSKSTYPNILFIVGNIVLALFWLIFVYNNFVGFENTRKISLALSTVSESMTVFLFLMRKRALLISYLPADWIIAFLGTFVGVLLRPTPALAGSLISTIGSTFAIVGTLLTILGYFSLNRSFGILVALRQIKTGGLYRWVRHPIYTAYILVITGYVISNFMFVNVVIASIIFIVLIIRLEHEEEFLAANNTEYANYMKQTTFKLVPFLY